jgi:acyl-CoA synthetase (NDP forming)
VTRKKPVFLLKGGATSEGARAAVAHTAAMAAEDRVIDGALRQAGITRIYQYSHLFLAAKALASMPLPRGNRVSFLAPSGAMLVVLTDLCLSLGLKVPPFEESTRQFLQSISTPIVRMRNPVDIWFSAGIHGVEFAYREGTEAALKDPNIDAVVPILLLTDEPGAPPWISSLTCPKNTRKSRFMQPSPGRRNTWTRERPFSSRRAFPPFP